MSHEFPYERQCQNSDRQQMCGAAVMVMVYRSFGKECDQAQVWKRISRPASAGRWNSRTHVLADDARAQGLQSLILKLKGDPWPTVSRSLDANVRIVVNHRHKISRGGHFSVLLDVSGDHVVYHDPDDGPFRRCTKQDFLGMWRPSSLFRQVAGQVLIAISEATTGERVCEQCHAEIPYRMECPGCAGDVSLEPLVSLGCIEATCSRRGWERLHCPSCDRAIENLDQSDGDG
ncbi:hypothetical protein Pan216_54700 [Planctomycetes bacterium Pan216]|uniref:Peptidase C39 domain-containing protein n=1 Tax=Kolteria novifilia TaxID=2527975 RepID=A0A518BC64_9BACT|nr:hypothetical protein Pan216_54700 [Planctomycetes bacterium Pan216]